MYPVSTVEKHLSAVVVGPHWVRHAIREFRLWIVSAADSEVDEETVVDADECRSETHYEDARVADHVIPGNTHHVLKVLGELVLPDDEKIAEDELDR